MHYLEGRFQLSNSTLDEADKVDIAIIELTDMFVKKLPDFFQFFDLNTFNLDHSDQVGMTYLLVGSPLSRYKLKLDIQKVVNEPFIFRTSRVDHPSTFPKLGVQKSTHLLVEYTRKRVRKSNDGTYITGPALNGMSGSGIWITPSFVSQNNFSDIKFYPTGILIEYHSEHCCVVSTRLRVVTEILKQCFNVPISKSKLLDLNFITNQIPSSSLPLRSSQL
ncbi:hypothetical protein DQQ10_05315 [Pseudochryseolinea flava]|uniref:Uncharacterized protein n=1 Tax=Pseudochryseolinea flava TaxID=2059302 RepID=A0A364Y539_9BACT|nr:hypothetical protein DQQ10_05315 [Pseudochryseolinea flava]